jgi:chromosomal replication initiator protein
MANMHTDSIWENVLEEIKLSVSPAVFQTLFSQIRPDKIGSAENNIKIFCPNPYIADLIQKRYLQLIADVLERQLNRKPIKVAIEIKQTRARPGKTGPLFEIGQKPFLEKPISHYNPKTGLHPKFTFDTFVVGNSNNFAFAAAQGIVKNPGLSYNPFFVWGGVGVGKTHLVQAIGHEILALKKDHKVLYTTAETFANDLINAIKGKSMPQFKQKYRQPDILIIDDVQFIAGKEYTQQEFFHTFNSLYIAEKQVILTSDRRPEEIKPVEDRLISRFMGGLTVDIQLPDYEMRVAILKKKAEEKKLDVPEEAVAFIAETIQSNTRELEGSLSQISARAMAQNSPVTLEMVKNFFGIKNNNQTKKINHRRILSVVSKTFNIKTGDLCGKTRKKQITQARHVAAYLLRRELDMSLQQVGRVLGGRDHTTIMHAEEKIDRSFSTNQQLRHQIIEIQKKIYQ